MDMMVETAVCQRPIWILVNVVYVNVKIGNQGFMETICKLGAAHKHYLINIKLNLLVLKIMKIHSLK